MYAKLERLFVDRCMIGRNKKGFVQWIVRKIQSKYTKLKHGVISLYDHVSLRIGNFVYESTIEREDGKKVHRIIKTPIADYIKYICDNRKKYRFFGILYDFDLTNSDWDKIKESAEKDVEDGIPYATKEILGTAKRIKQWLKAEKQHRPELMQKPNDNDSEAEYCISAIIKWIESCGKEFVTAHRSISIVDMPWLERIISCKSNTINVKNL